jgi:hypothetical protein
MELKTNGQPLSRRKGFLIHAAKCEEMATRADDPRLKQMWSMLASKWIQMATKIAPNISSK